MSTDLILSRLPNGMRILLKEIHTSPIISSWIWYGVGSRNESQGKTGLSHWVEHMQFKGTPSYPSGKLDRIISREGGIWNAFTYLDWTTFYETLPKGKIGLAFKLEADRMVNSRYDQDEFESERNVIISEREGNENEPLFMLGEAVQRTAFPNHPYGHEVIGDKEDLEQLTRQDLYDHYQANYTPSNALLSVAGDFDGKNLLSQIEDSFQPISPRPFQPLIIPEQGFLTSESQVIVQGPGETAYIQIAYRAPSGNTIDFINMTIIDSLLTGPTGLNMFGGGAISNKSSRLYRTLVDKEYAIGVAGGIQATIDPFLYVITITVNPEHEPEEAISVFNHEVQKLLDHPVSQQEVNRAIKQARALFAYGSESITNHAFWLGYSEMFASYDWFQSYLDRISQVTPKSALTCCQTYLNDSSRVVGFYLPTKKKAL